MDAAELPFPLVTRTTDLSAVDWAAGAVVLVDKPRDWSSFRAVSRLRRVAGLRKIGHAGTLDPLATGLLILCTGRATRSIDRFMGLPKVYTGTIRLGGTTASYDAEMPVEHETPTDHLTPTDITAALPLFIGEIRQTPPMFSAIKQNGTALYKLARKGETVERPERTVTVTSFELTRIALPDLDFRIACSKGTYIRSIAHDLGAALGVGGYLAALRRTHIGDFSADDGLTADQLGGVLFRPAPTAADLL